MERYDDKNLLCDVFDAYFYDSNDNLVFTSENLTSSDIKGSADEKEVRNGKGNGLFAKLYSNKKIDISLKTNAFDFATVALLAGTTVGTGTGTCFTPALMLTANVSDEIILPNIPKYPAKVEMFKDGTKVQSGAYTITNNTVVFTTTVTTGEEVKIMPFEFDVPLANDEYKEINISANKFPDAGKLVLKGIEKNKLTQDYKDLTIIIPQAQPASDFSLSTSSEVQATETEIKLSALVDNGRLMKIFETPHIEQDNGVFMGIGVISNLVATSTTIGEVDLTFSPSSDMTSAKIQYKETANSIWSDVTVGGTTGIRTASAINSTSTTATVIGLTSATSYDFKIVVVGGTHAGDSNKETISVA